MSSFPRLDQLYMASARTISLPIPARTTFLIVSAARDLRLMMRIVEDRILRERKEREEEMSSKLPPSVFVLLVSDRLDILLTSAEPRDPRVGSGGRTQRPRLRKKARDARKR